MMADRKKRANRRKSLHVWSVMQVQLLRLSQLAPQTSVQCSRPVHFTASFVKGSVPVVLAPLELQTLDQRAASLRAQHNAVIPASFHHLA
jgi:hypothetical protein